MVNVARRRHRVHVAAIGTVRSISVLGWTITLPQVVEDRIVRMRAQNLPAETGGVLFASSIW